MSHTLLKNLLPLGEGPRDPNIFKAVFTAGVPGGGKTTVIKYLLDGTGMKMVSFDDLYEFLQKKNVDREEALKRATTLLDKKLVMYINGRLGLIIDKTSWNYDKIRGLKEELELLGYDTFMVYINTDINVAKQRALDRYHKTGRLVDPEYIDRVFKKLSSNIGKYQQNFSDKFVVIDNSRVENDPAAFRTSIQFAQKKLNKFLRSDVVSPSARNWIKNTP